MNIQCKRLHCMQWMLYFYHLAKSSQNRSIWLKYRLYFSQIELKSFDLAKESLAFSNIFLKFAT